MAAEDRHLLARYVADRSETAFEGLVRRHGPMVMGVAGRVLKNTHDAEDAFQALRPAKHGSRSSSPNPREPARPRARLSPTKMNAGARHKIAGAEDGPARLAAKRASPSRRPRPSHLPKE